MRNYFSILLSLLIILTIAISCKNSTEPETVTGDLEVTVQIGNSYSSIARKAKVYIKDLGATVVADDYGKYLFRGIKEGVYEIYAYLEKTGSGKETIQIQKGILNKVKITLISGINNEPTISFLSPIISGSYYTTPLKTIIGDTIKFKFKITDNVTPSNQVAVTLSSDKAGILKEGFVGQNDLFEYSTNSLPKSRHIIKIVARDSEGFIGKDSLIIDNVKPTRVSLTAKVEQGNGVILNWSKCNDENFQKYVILRSSDRNWSYSGYIQTLQTINDKNITSFTDVTPPIVDSVFYKVVSYNSAGENTESYSLRVNDPVGKKFAISLKDAVIHPTMPYLYITTTDKKLVVFNYETQEIIKTIQLVSEPSYMAIGNTGLGIELFVPDRDGFLSIYNPLTFQKSAYLNLSSPIYSLALDDAGYIYAMTYKNSQSNIISLSRSDGKQISSLACGSLNGEPGMMGILPNKMAIISMNNSNAIYIRTGANGALVSYKSTYLSNNGSLFRISPNGEYIATSTYGDLYATNETFTKLSGLPRGNSYLYDFGFADNGNTIFTPMGNYRYVYAFDFKTRDNIKQINTGGYPKRIFIKGSKLVCISAASSDFSSSNLLFEVISLN